MTRNPKLFYEDEFGITQVVEFDVVSATNYHDPSEATEYPVEGGGIDVTDNIRDLPKVLTIEGLVSNTPLNSNPGGNNYMRLTEKNLNLPRRPRFFPTPGEITARVIETINPRQEVDKAVVWTPINFIDRCSEMHRLLSRLKVERTKFSYQGPYRSLENLYIVDYAGPESPDDGEAAVFSITLKEVETTTVEIVSAPIPTEALGMKKASTGSKSANTDSDKKAEQKKSAAAKMLDGIKGSDVVGKLGETLTGLL